MKLELPITSIRCTIEVFKIIETMIKCPHCNKELKIAPRCYLNAETYHNVCYCTTECCNKLISLEPITKFIVEKVVNTTKTEDDWGIKFTK